MIFHQEAEPGIKAAAGSNGEHGAGSGLGGIRRDWVRPIVIALVALAVTGDGLLGAEKLWEEVAPLQMPEVGTHGLRVISPTVLELVLVNTKASDPARVAQWDFVADGFQGRLPGLGEFSVRVDGGVVGVSRVGFKRRVLYAPLKKRDLRIGNYLYLELAEPVLDGQRVEVNDLEGRLWPGTMRFSAVAEPLRFSPAIHVNQVGYVPGWTKKAMVGYYLGTFGELAVPVERGFRVINATDGQVVHEGALVRRPDRGYTYGPTPYQQVFEADFTALTKAGEYRLQVPGLGVSYPFLISEGTAAAFARTYALGLYHQRCGGANALPFTRCEHAECHTAPAEVPTVQDHHQQQTFLAQSSSDYAKEPRHTAPQLQDVDSSLYPFVQQGTVDVSGGHHDAGDYSKYTINSAGLIHHLVFAADNFGGAGELDNLGLPESGDGKSDLLQEAKWEADFLAKMQDADGGFYFLVYPRDRRYEDTVLPDQGDPQIVWPKNTAATAAAVAALAEMGSSPRFRAQFPAEAESYLAKAELGWAFLEKAMAKFGKDGAYQKLTHYGNEFMHDDELAWAAAALFGATGKPVYQERLKAWFNPASSATRRWSWWRLFEAYGCAVRSYAFAVRSGRLSAGQMDSVYLAKCEAEIQAAAEDHARFSRENAYGTSFPSLSKQVQTAGWYFSAERAFDVAVAYQANPKPEFLDVLLANFNYEGGNNPVNVTFVTGLGMKRQREIVHQYAQNDRRVLPPTGVPLGNIQSGFSYTWMYKTELTGLNFPAEGTTTAPYPFYDRWGDSFNTTTEFVVVDQARSLAGAAFLMALTALKDQPWRSGVAEITGLPTIAVAEESVTATISAPGMDLSLARIVWESPDQEPQFGTTFTFSPKNPGEQWVEVEVQLPDGRRMFARAMFTVMAASRMPPNSYRSVSLQPTEDMVALFPFDNGLADATGRGGGLRLIGQAKTTPSNVGWMTTRAGASLYTGELGDRAIYELPSRALAIGAQTTGISLEAMIYVNSFRGYNRGNVRLLSLYDHWNAFMELSEDAYNGPQVKGGAQLGLSGSVLTSVLRLKEWHHVSLSLDRTGYTVRINGQVVSQVPSSELSNWGKSTVAVVEVGNFDGWVDEIVVRKLSNSPALAVTPLIEMSSPTTGTSYAPNKEIVLRAAAYAPAAAIANVEFFDGALKLGEVQQAPFEFVWSNGGEGQHALTARVTDTRGSKVSAAPVTVSIVALPTIVSTPVITPNGGVFPKPIPVTLATATPGAVIRYTTDGREPSGESPQYSSPFTVASTATVKAKAFKVGLAASGLATATVVIDPDAGGESKAAFVSTDAVTQGNWRGKYGALGYQIMGDGASLPAGMTVQGGAQQSFAWTSSTTEIRALQKTTSSDRLAACWYAGGTFTVDLNLSSVGGKRIAFYVVDWDRQNRRERFEFLDAVTGAVLDSRTVSDFQEGKYLVWDVQGSVRVRVTNVSGPNAVLMGIFVDQGPVPVSGGEGKLNSLRRLSTGEFQAAVTGELGLLYRIEASTNLVDWTELLQVVLSSTNMTFTDPGARLAPTRFYRVVRVL